MIRLIRLMEAIGHAYSYQGKPLAASTIDARAADTAGRLTHQPKPQSRRKHQ